jgi:hypothetical protein
MPERMEGTTLPQESEKKQFDVRGLWNVIERLANAGNKEDAQILMELENDPVIHQRLVELAKEGGIEGGTNLAEQSAMEALENEE